MNKLICKEISYTLFCKSKEVNDSVDFVKDLFDVFYKDKFTISTIQLNNFVINSKNLIQSSSANTIDRPQLINKSTNEVITVLPDRIDYVKGFKIEKDIRKEILIEDTLCGIDYLGRILNLLTRNASRLAFNIDYINLKDEDLNLCDKISNKYYSSKKMTEQTSRYVIRETHKNETFNIIQQISYTDKSLLSRAANFNFKYSGTTIHNDINTHQSSTSERINEVKMRELFEVAIDINKKIMEGLKI